MTCHITGVEWAEALAGEEGALEVNVPLKAHLEECRACRRQHEQLCESLARFGAAAREEADRPEAFWTRQRAEISSRIAQRRSMTLRLTWVTSMAALALAANLLLRPAPPQATWDPDDALLRDVQTSLWRAAPASLSPASLLAEEMNQAANAAVKTESEKENPQ